MRRWSEPDSFKFSMLRLLILSPSTRQALGFFLCTWIQVCGSVQFHIKLCFNRVLLSPGILNPDHPPPAKVKTVRVERIVGAGGVQQQSLETEMGIIICTKLDFVNFQSVYLDRSSTTYSVLGLVEKVSSSLSSMPWSIPNGSWCFRA